MTADRKISELPVAATLDGTELVPVVQGGDNVRTTIALFASGGSVIATGGTEARTLANHFGDTLNAKDFGAVGDNVADDTAALNAFFAAIRAARMTSVMPEGSTIRACIPPGVYKCGNINATGIRALNWVLECSGAILNGATADGVGKPVLDLIGSRWFTIKDLTIWGDTTNRPKFGLQHGRESYNFSRGEMTFLNCQIDGYFSKACYVNMGSEIVSMWHPTFFNRETAANSYVAILDGMHSSGITSDFITITLTPDAYTGSFIDTTWISCDLRKLVSGKCFLTTGSIHQHHFVNGYMVSFDDAAFYISEATVLRQIILDVHFETGLNGGSTGLTSCVLIDNTTPATTVIITDLQVRDHQPQCIDSIINMTGTTRTVCLDDCSIRIGIPQYAVPIIGTGAGSFNKVLVNGKISYHGTINANLDLSNMIFTGDIECLDISSMTTTHGIGGYRLIRRGSTAGDRTLEFKGPVRSFGRSDSTLPANYAELNGSIAGSAVSLLAGGTDTNINIDLTPKGSGIVNTGGLALTGDASITKATPSLVIDKTASGQNGSVSFKTGGLLRWNLQSESTAESAGAGSNFALKRYDDAGTVIELALLVSRSSGNFLVTRSSQAHFGTAIPAGGTAGAGFLLSSTANFGTFFGSGAPTLSAAKGSLYLRSDGSGTNDRMYVNTNGSTTWTAVVTVA